MHYGTGYIRLAYALWFSPTVQCNATKFLRILRTSASSCHRARWWIWEWIPPESGGWHLLSRAYCRVSPSSPGSACCHPRPSRQTPACPQSKQELNWNWAMRQWEYFFGLQIISVTYCECILLSQPGPSSYGSVFGARVPTLTHPEQALVAF